MTVSIEGGQAYTFQFEDLWESFPSRRSCRKAIYSRRLTIFVLVWKLRLSRCRVCEPDAATQPTAQDNQLTSKHRVLNLEPQLRLEGEARMAKAKQSSLSFRQLRRFHHVINSDKVFGTHSRTTIESRGATVVRGTDVAGCAGESA
jgi:hypothetical protein